MKIKYKIYYPSAVILFPLIAFLNVFVQEWLARNSLKEAANWISTYPIPFLLNFFIHSLVLGLFIALIGRVRLGLIFSSIFLLILGGINAAKTGMLHVPFFAWDLLYMRQLWVLGEAMLPGYVWVWIILFSVLLLFLIIRHELNFQIMLRARIRATIMAIVLFLACLSCWQYAFMLNMLNVQNIAWDQSLNHHDNGFMLAFAMNVSPLFIKKPMGYSHKLVEKVLSDHKSAGTPLGINGKPVNLVIILSESFSDLYGAPLKTNMEPMPNMKRISSSYPHFTLVSPTFAGDTSLVEYEVLTGLSNAFIPQGSVPFEHYIRRPIPSLPWVLRNNGYRTIAVHPFHDWFWNRKIVYPLLGFEEFIAIDQFEGATKRGEFISDENLVDKIIKVINEQNGNYMIYAVSMQNHGPFWSNRYPTNEVKVSANVSEWMRGELEAFLTGVLDADRQLERLLTYLKSRKEPVICIFFGDHQPALSASLYGEMGMVKDYFPAFMMQLSQVPGIIWANPKELLNSISIPAIFSPAYLPPILLKQMGITLSGHFDYLMKGLSEVPVLNRGFAYAQNGTISLFKRQNLSPYLKGLEILNYDLLFGSQFCWHLPMQPQ
ncbi:MAG: LTA synthase family protein [Desulfobacterales bacterium]|nr:LTA synthase family protein [Desulfobacterales bacterium]MBF0397851.1 LTA synthase family protein [Desulfobacterales bacterium]